MLTAIFLFVFLVAGFALGATYGQAAERKAIAKASKIFHDAESLKQWVISRVKGVL